MKIKYHIMVLFLGQWAHYQSTSTLKVARILAKKIAWATRIDKVID